jgi:hypothetical protein
MTALLRQLAGRSAYARMARVLPTCWCCPARRARRCGSDCARVVNPTFPDGAFTLIEPTGYKVELAACGGR